MCVCVCSFTAPNHCITETGSDIYTATGASGAHWSHVVDKQPVLGHSDPATTMKSYLAPMRTDVLDRAAAFLD